jgi:C4-dicarboxylate-specific signal transduction histidine kinase
MKYLETYENKIYKIDQIDFAVAHHLGNPIDAIDSFNSLAKKFLEKGDIEKVKECMEDMDKAIENAKSIINDFRNGNISFK